MLLAPRGAAGHIHRHNNNQQSLPLQFMCNLIVLLTGAKSLCAEELEILSLRRLTCKLTLFELHSRLTKHRRFVCTNLLPTELQEVVSHISNVFGMKSNMPCWHCSLTTTTTTTKTNCNKQKGKRTTFIYFLLFRQAAKHERCGFFPKPILATKLSQFHKNFVV